MIFKKDSKKFYFVLSMLIPMVINCMSFFQSYDIAVINDEIGSMASMAALAGFDWKDVISTCKYYGVGFNWIYAVFYKFLADPLKIYIGIHILNYMFASFSAGISYNINIKYLKFENARLACLAACLAGVTGIAGGFKIYNETGIYFTTWIVLYLLLNLLSTQEQRIRKTLILAAVLTWQQLIHTRTIVFVWIVIAAVILLKIFNQKTADIKILILMTAAGCLMVRLIKKHVLSEWWLNSGVSGSGFNAAVPIRLNQTWIFTTEGIKMAGKMFISNVLTAANRSYGIFICALMIGFLACFKLS